MRKKSGRRRTEGQRNFDFKIISKMYLQGHSMRFIADALNSRPPDDVCPNGYEKISFQQVSYDIKQIKKWWREDAVEDINEAKLQELAKIDNLEAELWAAYERSRQPPPKTEVTSIDDADKTVTKVTQQDGVGDIRFLNAVLDCIKQRSKILGIEAPKDFNMRYPEGLVIQIDWQDEVISPTDEPIQIIDGQHLKAVKSAVEEEMIEEDVDQRGWGDQ